MQDIAPPTVTVQIQPSSSPAIPTWMGEVAAFARVLTHTGMLKTIQEQVRFTRARFGQYDLIDFAVVLIGYILSGEPTLLAFYERLARLRLILHGAFWPRPLAPSLNSVSVSGCSRSRKSGGASQVCAPGCPGDHELCLRP